METIICSDILFQKIKQRSPCLFLLIRQHRDWKSSLTLIKDIIISVIGIVLVMRASVKFRISNVKFIKRIHLNTKLEESLITLNHSKKEKKLKLFLYALYRWISTFIQCVNRSLTIFSNNLV